MVRHLRQRRASVAVLAAVCLVYILLASTVHAAIIRGGEHYVLEEQASVQGDAYFVGNKLYIYGSTTDDAFAAGNEVEIEGTIGEDALVLAGSIDLSGNIEGDARLAGGIITVRGSTSEDLIALGGSIIMSDDSHVGGNVLVYAEEVSIEGTIRGALEVHARRVVVNGTIEGGANITALESLSLTEQAYLSEGLTYSAPRELYLSDGATVLGDIEYIHTTGSGGSSFNMMGFLTQTLIAIVAAVLLMLLFPVFTRRASEVTLHDNGLIALKGLAVLLAIPFVVLALATTVVGILPAVIIGCFWRTCSKKRMVSTGRGLRWER